MVTYKNLTLAERHFLNVRHDCLTNLPSVELTSFLKNPKMLPAKPGVYIMWRKSNDHIYIGESVNVRNRLIEHSTQQFPKQYIDRDINKFGPEHFRVGFIEGVSDQKKRRLREGHFVTLFNSYHNGYNGSPDGNPMSAFQRWARRTWRSFLSTLFPRYVKRKRRRNAFQGTRALQKYSKRLKRNRRRKM